MLLDMVMWERIEAHLGRGSGEEQSRKQNTKSSRGSRPFVRRRGQRMRTGEMVLSRRDRGEKEITQVAGKERSMSRLLTLCNTGQGLGHLTTPKAPQSPPPFSKKPKLNVDERPRLTQGKVATPSLRAGGA